MFLERLAKTNPALLQIAKYLHQKGSIDPDTYVLDVDGILENAKMQVESASECGLELFLMTKQFGRNPYLAERIVKKGFKGVVAVDIRDALSMIEQGVPLSHVGHLVQIPTHKLETVLSYGVQYMTIYSIEKAAEINAICEKLEKVQSILLKIWQPGDFLYPGQEGGFKMDTLLACIQQIKKFSHVKIVGLTAFPCLLYNQEENRVQETPNARTLREAKAKLDNVLGYPMILNMPSCTQAQTIRMLQKMGANQAEPGSSLLGMTPNEGAEKVTMVYVSEIAHHYDKWSYSYGGGAYPRGVIQTAYVQNENDTIEKVNVAQPLAEHIDYHIKLEGHLPIGATVLMCFRTQMFVTRSKVALVEGISKGAPKLIGIYDSQGRREC